MKSDILQWGDHCLSEGAGLQRGDGWEGAWRLGLLGVKIPEIGPTTPQGLGPVDPGSCPEAPLAGRGEGLAAPPGLPSCPVLRSGGVGL